MAEISPRICVNCVKDYYLKRFVSANGNIGYCLICEAEHVTCEISDPEFSTILKASIRYHYSERVYNSHWGGYFHWVDLFHSENEIFSFIVPRRNSFSVGNESFDKDNLLQKFDILYDVLEQIETHISDYGSDVSLYYGGDRLDHHVRPVKNDYSTRISILKRKMDYINYPFLLVELNDLLQPVLERVKVSVQNAEYYRARIGIKEHIYDDNSANFDYIDEVFVPYVRKEIAGPPIKLSTEGRLNRKGTSFLYLTTDKQTALSEVKPSTGHLISIGKFRLREREQGWIIADFANLDFYDYHCSDDDISDFVLLNSIKKELLLPNPDKDYRFTQMISDILISHGFHGVLFNSSVSEGHNLVVFHPQNTEYIPMSHEVVKIKKIHVEFSELSTEIKGDIYYSNSQGQPFEDGPSYYRET